MRRLLFALLVPLSTIVVPGTPVAGAAEVSHVPSIHSHHVNRALVARQRLAEIAHNALAHVAATVQLSLAQLHQEWERVAICEVGGNWSMRGPVYSGIGFLNSTWRAYGGTHFAPVAGMASKDEQILVGMRINNGWVPDQYGCDRFGW